ncbi:alpha/beta hydrolase family protein [Sphingomonas endolithica]|uniref:alpha/beta hydrolase family protein n=1 Tax=Sphingomonas endolithica TaxID=2972485 RepID=UPI0021AF5752|nr:prolyl oligopeptidase family serine peptidase [Sphingomonas sp. ZFBP2030]
MAITLSACNSPSGGTEATETLATARAGHVTAILDKTKGDGPAPQPPKGVLDLIHYTSPAGQLAAYVTPKPAAGGRHPAIIWISGGDSNSIGDFWSKQDPANDQTASAFREAGIVTIYPSLRGGNDNPGYREGFYGEIDDILAAAAYLAKLDYVDPTRIYLGGQSTGGTTVLLAAEASDRFRGVFAFGAADDVRSYGSDYNYADPKDEKEMRLRSPVYWLESVKRPTWVIEGTGQGNIESLDAMRAKTANPQLHFLRVAGRGHFDVLAPVTTLIARKIVAEAAGKGPVAFSAAEVDAAGR